MTIQTNSFVRWSFEDGSYDGEVLAVTNSRIILQTDVGIIGVDQNDGEFKQIKRPANKPVTKLVKIVEPVRETVRGSKKELAMAIYNANKDEPKSHVVELFVKQLGMTPAGASTYYYNCKKA